MGHKTPPPCTCTKGGHGWCCSWKGRRVPDFSTQLSSSSHDGCYTSLEDFLRFPGCLVHAIGNFPPPNTLPAAATLPNCAFPWDLGFSQTLRQERSSCWPLPPTSGNHEWSNGAGDGNLGLAPLAHLPQPRTRPGDCTKPPADLGTLPLVEGNSGQHLPGRRRRGGAGAAAEPALSAHGRHSLRSAPARAAFLPSPGVPQFSLCTSAHVLQEPQPVAKRLQMLEELCTAAGQQQQRGKYK